MLKGKKIADFLTDLASKKPAPGGGSASALAGAMAAGLVVKVAELTLGKEKYKERQGDFEKIRAEAREKLTKLTKLIEEDTKAYRQVVKTKFSQPAVKYAAKVPLETAQVSLTVLKMASVAAKYGNQNCRSDALCAIKLATAAIDGALENVRANLPFIKDKKFCQKLKDQIEEITSLAFTNNLC